jgi:hypothetical protein
MKKYLLIYLLEYTYPLINTIFKNLVQKYIIV